MKDITRKETREMLQKVVGLSKIEDIKRLSLAELENRMYQITNLANHYIHHVLYSNKD